MTNQQRRNKIAELSEWLTNNPNHPNRNLVQNDKRCLELELSNLETDDEDFDPTDLEVVNPELL